MTNKLTIKKVIEKIFKVHGNTITLDQSTYKDTRSKARFIDKEFGEFWSLPMDIFVGRGHKKRTNEKRKQTCLKKYGVENISQVKTIKEKKKQASLKKYGTEYTFQAKEVKQKSRQTMLEKYGFEYPLQNKEIRKQFRQTCLERYGSEYPLQNKEIQEKFEQTCLERYGVRHAMKDENVKKKKQDTCLEKYGNICSLHGPEQKEKTKQTNIKRYGFQWPIQNDEIKEKRAKANIDKFGGPSPMCDKDVALKNAKAHNNSHILIHWFSREDIVCVASYERKTVEYFNNSRIDYNWQIQTFLMPDGRTFRPDCYLPDQDLWIEIKGYFRDDAQEKWEWFHKEYPNSELWDKKKLKEMKIL